MMWDDRPVRYGTGVFCFAIAASMLFAKAEAVANGFRNPPDGAASLGAGIDILYSDIDLRQNFPRGMVTGNPLEQPGRAQLEGDGAAVGGRAGVTWIPDDTHRLAFTARSPVKVEYQGDFTVSNVPAGLPGPLPLLVTSNIPEDWDDTWTVGLGLTYDLTEMLVVRGGYVFLETPIPERTLAPTLPDSDRHVLSAGVGVESGAHELDLAYHYSIYDDADVTDNVVPAFNGQYDIESHLGGADLQLPLLKMLQPMEGRISLLTGFSAVTG